MKRPILCLLMAFWAISSFGAPITFNGAGDGTTWEDPTNWDSGSLPTAADDVFINGNFNVTLSTAASIRNLSISNTAELQVNASADLSIANSVDIGTGFGGAIVLSDDAKLINDGTLDIQDVNDGGDGINLVDNSYFENNGTVTIQNMSDDGIELDNTASLKNTGTINIDNVESEGLQQDDDSQVVNEGIININDADGDGICMDDSDVVFTNSGAINISSIGDNAIELDDGLFTNSLTGIIRLFDLSDKGLDIMDDGTFDNLGEMSIVISDASDPSDYAVDIESRSTLTNQGLLSISITGMETPDAIFVEANGAALNNLLCGVIDVQTEHGFAINSGGSLTNEGLISTAFTGTHDNGGTFTNEAGAFLLSPGGTLVAAPNAVVNNGSIEEGCDNGEALNSLCNGGPCTVIAPLPAFSGKLLFPFALILLSLCAYLLVIKLD